MSAIEACLRLIIATVLVAVGIVAIGVIVVLLPFLCLCVSAADTVHSWRRA